ncbi:MAG: hypothetical protein IKQ72_03035 [Bacteroidaceae bacterium]|nr:hypothetical protein [Bacteroidaceae bacterium]
MNLRKLLVLSAAIFGIGGNADVFAMNDESVTDERMANLIYNPNFSLVKPNTYSELIGWKVYDANVSAPRTGGMNASCATADPTWTKFNNAKGSVNLDGEENRFSTAAMFKFPETPSKFCSSSSRYVYGDVDMDDTGALWLSSNSCFEFSAQLGYLNENEKGSVTFEIVKYDGQVVKTFTYTPTVCVSDTTKTPEVIRFSFLTDCFNTEYYGQHNYRMQYYRMQYKIVVRNTIPGDHWTLVMSNLKLCEIKPQNLIYNPNFSLVRENSYCELTGWEVYDPSVSNPRTGGMGATSATSDRMWTHFDNAKGSVNLDGEENIFSTAAMFVFPEKPNSFCSSSSQYVYGNSTGYELMLEPNQLYRFHAELGYENEGEKGSVIFEIVNNKTGHKVLLKIIESQVCVTDTTLLPQFFLTYFKTDDASGNESYKLVVRNSNPNDYWTLVMSNLALRKWYDFTTVGELIESLTNELGNSSALLRSEMNRDVESALRAAQHIAENVDKNDESAIMAALDVLKEKNRDAVASVKVYDEINKLFQKGDNLDADGKAAFDSSVADVKTKWTNGEITDGVEELATVKSKYVDAIKQQTSAGAVMTEAISNWDCTSGYLKYQFPWEDRANAIVKDWKVYDENDVEITDDGSHPISEYFHVNTWLPDDSNPGPMANPFAEFWSEVGVNYLGQHHIKIMHTQETGYRAGRYKLGIMARLNTVDADASSITGYKFIVNGLESQSRFTMTSNGDFYALDEIEFDVDESGTIDFGYDLDHPNFYWIAFKMLKLSYEGDVKSDSVNIDITDVNKEESENTTTPVASQTEDGDTYYVFKPEDETKNQTISFDIPVEVVVAGNKYYVVIVLVPTDETRTRPTYITFELKGAPHKKNGRSYISGDGVTNVLGSYYYTGEKEERLVYEFTASQDIESASISISTENPKDGDMNCTSAIGLKQVSIAEETNNSTAIENVASEQTEVVPVGIYNASGVRISSFQKGVNIVRFSDGSVRKIQY